MRGDDEQQLGVFSNVSPESEFLKTIRCVRFAPWPMKRYAG